MGLAELLASIGISYDSDQAVRLTSRIARRIGERACQEPASLAESRGTFPLYHKSTLAGPGPPSLRNAQLTSLAPTGTISLIAGTTAGIETMFAIGYLRNILGRHLVETNPLFGRIARDRGFYSDQLMTGIARTGRVRGNALVPTDVQSAFPTALEIIPKWHLRMQAAAQRYIDAAVSKTINLPADATTNDVRSIFLASWRARVKGITVYRYGSKPGQVLLPPSRRKRLRGPCARPHRLRRRLCRSHLRVLSRIGRESTRRRGCARRSR